MSSGPQRGTNQASDEAVRGGSSNHHHHHRRSTKRRSSAQRPDNDQQRDRTAVSSREPESTTKRSNSYQLPPLNWELAAAVAQARVNELRRQLEAPIPLPAIADATRQEPSRDHSQPEARRFALPAAQPSPEVVVVDEPGAAEAADTAEDDVLLLLSSRTQPPISSQGQASYAESGIVFSSETRPLPSPFVVASHADQQMPSVSGSTFTASSSQTIGSSFSASRRASDEPSSSSSSSSSSWNLFRRNDYSYNDHGLGDRVFDQAAQEAESDRQAQKLRRELLERSRNEPRLGASMLRLVDRFIAMSRGPIGPSQQLARALDLCPCYASVALRVHTFKYRPWPVELADLALSLVDAGFFYRGVDDLVTCYSCYGSLRNWQPYSNPWVQHALAFPRCLHVLRVRGRSFPCTEWTFLLEDIRRQPSRWSAIDPEYMFRRDRRGYATETFDTIPLPPRYGGYRDPREDGGSSARPPRHSSSSTLSNQPDASSMPSQPQQQQQQHHHYQPSMPRRRPSHPVPTVFGSMHEGLRVPEPPVTPAPASPATAYVADLTGDFRGSPIVVRFATESEYLDAQRFEQRQSSASAAFASPANVTPYQQQQPHQIVQVCVPQPRPQQPIDSLLPSPPITVPRAPTPSATTIAESNAATSSRISSQQQQQQPPPQPPQPRIADNTKLCIICCENEVELAFVPCGHAITCRACSVEMFDCCYCRQEIHDRLRIYLL